MTTLRMYSIHDSKAEFYQRPFCGQAHGEAIRNFARAVNDDQTELYHNPEDFTLFYVGDFDMDKGHINPATPMALSNGIEHKNGTSAIGHGPSVLRGSEGGDPPQ